MAAGSFVSTTTLSPPELKLKAKAMSSDQTSRGHNFEGLSAGGNARQHNGDINAQVYNSEWMPHAIVRQCCYKHQITDFLARLCILPAPEIIFPQTFAGRT